MGVGNEGPSYTIRCKDSPRKPALCPGPGAYTLVADKTGPPSSPSSGFGLGNRKENFMPPEPEFPGPGTYYDNLWDSNERELSRSSPLHMDSVSCSPDPYAQ